MKMTSFEEIVRVADGKKVPDPFVNTKKIILQMCCVKVKPFELNTEANEAVVCSTRTLSSFNLLSFLFSPKKFRGQERGPEGGPEEGVQVLSTPPIGRV